ncbi:glutathione S-transferase 1-1 isoform X3 [Leptinotarsa decemlineata]|uniref:glutathione S-transferase 1-1 isoform X3 n=1 Tax=Leptinotarsa decemlineata TaxID=7539 RepID=UPI003D30BBA8
MESEGIVPLNNSIFNAKMANHTIDIYFFTMSPPSRAALLLMRALGLKHNIKIVNVLAGEQMNPEFIKINPLHTIPVINDGGFILPDSNAIMKYLVDQYAKDDSLFPRDPKKSAIVIQRLFFVSGYLFPRFVAYHACGSCDISAHQNLFQWFQKTKTAMESFGYDEVMQAGAEAFGALYKSRLK